MSEDMKEVSGPRKDPDAGRIVPPVQLYFIYRAGGAMVAYVAHNHETRFESFERNHCGVEKRLSRHPHKVEIVGSTPTHRNHIKDAHSNLFY